MRRTQKQTKFENNIEVLADQIDSLVDLIDDTEDRDGWQEVYLNCILEGVQQQYTNAVEDMIEYIRQR